jgi:NAD(P)-dependent dehydrogenase (short-subunit alcohol dehydrogenase family)
MSENAKPPVDAKHLALCIEVLESVASDQLLLSQLSREERIRLFQAAGRVIYPDRHTVRRRVKALRTQKKKDLEAKDRLVRAATSIRSTRRESVFIAPPKLIASEESTQTTALLAAGELQRPRDCYVCKASFTQVHFFYDSMCPRCAPFNYEKRFQTASLDGQVAIITGARLKIGYQAALLMLRAGARVIVTTRFPQDAAMRFVREPEFAEWGHRLQVYGLDLRHSPSVEAFTAWMDQTLDRLDILINNAAQTVRRPPGFYAHLMELESLPYASLSDEVRAVLRGHEELKAKLGASAGGSAENLGLNAGSKPSSAENLGPNAGPIPGSAQNLGPNADLRPELHHPEKVRWLSEWHEEKTSPLPGLTASAALSQIPYRCDEVATTELFPEGKLDADLQQVDRRKMNSWRMTLADVPTAEMLEVQLVNSVAPFILCSKLKPLMERHRTDAKHIVNVSAMEGKFSRHTKTDKHPHTNMAKAALNMMTLTSARDYARSGIYMNAVDTGWVTDEDPIDLSTAKQEAHDFQPPLDIVDGAARVCDPFFAGLLSGKHSWGNFLKDYFPTEW